MSPDQRTPTTGVTASASHRGQTRAWVVLLISALLEAVWATALSRSEGFSVLLPTVVFGIALVLSMIGLGQAMRHIPLSIAYAVWTGLGAALTATIAIVSGAESAHPLKILFLAGIVACVVGLKFAKAPAE